MMTADATINLPIISTRGTALALEQIARTRTVLAALHGVDPSTLTVTLRAPDATPQAEAAKPVAAEVGAG